MAKTKLLSLILAVAVMFVGGAFAQANIEIVNLNAGSGQGFDDPRSADPVGGNLGTTLGQQRLNAFKEAARIWGDTLTSTPTIRILASFEPLACTADSAVLGSAGTTQTVADFPGAQFPRTWYPIALANKRAGVQLLNIPGEIRARFNSQLGATNCLTGSGWYLGFDGNEPTGTNDLVAVLLHEFGHGLGFASFVNKKTGSEFKGWTDVYSRNIVDNNTGINWGGTTPSIRRKSTTAGNLVWTGAAVTSDAQFVLSFPPRLLVTAPTSIARSYQVGTASFGTQITQTGISGQMALVSDGAAGTHLACAALPSGSLADKIALVDRGACTFVQKAQNVQAAGAKGMVVADNDPTATAPAGLGGTDPSITIPAVRITFADGKTIENVIATQTVSAALKQDTDQPRSGSDAQSHVRLYAPAVLALGSSVSHYDTSAFRNLLMEPFINGDLTHQLDSPEDLTFELMKDIGW